MKCWICMFENNLFLD